MTDDKLTAVTVACVLGLLTSWQTLEHYGAEGLTFKEWLVGILAGMVIGGATGRAGYVVIQRINRDDEQ